MRKTSSLCKHLLSFAFLFLVSLFCFAPAVLAAPSDLPPADLFKPDPQVVTTGGSAAVFIKVISWLVALVAGIYFAWALFHFVLHDLRDIFTGKADLKGKSTRFVALGVCFIILLLAITGQWYTVVQVVWDKIVTPLINTLGGK
ncbi:hypothetical protein [Desulfofundulus thermosubterraneus]|uniref:Uncharacterized protein n=1 Tax=Desulfofundulus thermosubterraneus DSM 16057 TaxID=1121432 RepID=A0A1M6M3B2_9FIRM|nr:hypothetical protein [Desulfofundulus thermosubterraneus]SHJ77931.1 hypothetical protein SAMN02745219_03314 [Desulfofundulus thermosubterraneus DSM 16057]